MKTALIMDGSFLLYKNVFILKPMNRIKQDLKDMLLSDISKLTKSFYFDNIYYVSDSKEGNWRKQIYKDYKANRSRDETIDWDMVFKIYTEFKEELKDRKNIKFLEIPGLEGDDLIAHIILENNNKNISNVLVASDTDMTQLLRFDLNKKFINIQWNYKLSDERLYLPENYQLLISELSNTVNEDAFELDNSVEFVDYFEKMIQRAKIKTVTCEEVSFCKMVQGDKGDNIKSCAYTKDGKMNLEGRGIGGSGAETLYKLYKEIHPSPIEIESDEFISNLSDVIIYYKKLKDPNAKKQIMENLIFNRKMMILNTIHMPPLVLENMKNYYNEIDSRVIIHEPIDLERQLEMNDFFNEKVVETIPEQFNMVSDGETFDPDSSFWSL